MNLGRAKLVVSLFAVAVVGCGKGEELPPEKSLAASFVNDSCAAHTAASACLADTAHACSWVDLPVESCPTGATCPRGACVTPDPCVGMTTEKGCAADTRCAWTAAKTNDAVTLCPVGGDCGASGFCHLRDASGGGCACLRPIACPSNSDCPAVQCDCAPPPSGGGSGGGTCACNCPACPPGASCAPCQCDCGGGSGACDGGPGTGTCTCACTDCYGPNCPPCDCACGAGMTSAGGAGTASRKTASDVAADPSPPSGAAAPAPCSCGVCPEGALCGACDCPVVADPCAQFTTSSTCYSHNADRCAWYSYGFECGDAPCANGYCYRDTTPIDPCASHTDTTSCKGDVANSCGWIALDIACVTAPCPQGSCAQMKPVPGGGCACACPSCVAGESCPPCACNCCGT
jgi:hypothetical protein